MKSWVSGLIRIGAFFLVVGAIGAAILYWPQKKDTASTAAGDWTCSMHPQIRQPGPGRCPICGMDLIPVAELASSQTEMARRIGVEVEPVEHRELYRQLRTTGKLDYNERQVAYIPARVEGRVDTLYADFAGIQVKKGDHLVDIYSPELYVAQGELIRAANATALAKSKPGSFTENYADADLEAARTKLRLLGLLPEQIQEIERSKTTTTHLTIHAPIGGTVIEKNVRVGQYVKEGDMLYRIANLDPIWLYLDVYEYDLALVRFGQNVVVTVEAYPGETFNGTVAFVDPFLDDKSRTVKVRVNLKNPDRKLKPAMYAFATIRVRLQSDGTPEPTGLEGKYVCPMHPEVVQDKEGKCTICGMALERIPGLRLATPPRPTEHAGHQHMDSKPPQRPTGKVLAIRASAALDTGKRRIAYRQDKNGAFELVELTLGPRSEGLDDAGKSTIYYPVLSGLNAGDKVVVRGGFLLDSQRQIEGMPSLLFPQGQSAGNLHSGHAMPASPSGEHKH